MNKLRVSLLLLILSLGFVNLKAQIDEEEVTESSILEDTTGYLDDIIERKNVLEQRMLAYEPIREADIVWQKRIWRVLDVREKMNQPFIYPSRPFFKILIDAAESGEFKIFGEDDFKKPLVGDALQKMLHSVDTVPVWNPDTYVEELKIVVNDIDFNDIKTFRIKEMWYFDKESSRLNCRILGIAPIKQEVDESSGVIKYEGPMFWIYYPEARKLLSKERVFNEKNDISPGTWADVFDGRFFSSYIFKESNVEELRLKDIFAGENDGVKLLLESDRIKNELLNFEHDLWVY